MRDIRKATRGLAHLLIALLEKIRDRIDTVVSLARIFLPLFLVLALFVIDLLRATLERKPRLTETHIFEQILRHLVQKHRRLGSKLFTVNTTLHRMRHVEVTLSTRHRNVREPPLFFQFRSITGRTGMWKQSFLETNDKHDRKFEPLRSVYSH